MEVVGVGEQERKGSLQLKLYGDVDANYRNSIRSKVTQHNYTYAIDKYKQFLKVQRTEDLLLPPSQIKLIEANIISYLVYLNKERHASFGTANGYLAAIKLLYNINDYNLNKRKLARYLPDKSKQSDDRGYSTEEIATMLQGADERLRALILLLACTGMRIGAIADKYEPLLQLRHLHFISEYKLYKVTVYEGYKEEYFCFTTPEAAAAIDSYLRYRERYGERLTPDSYLFREQFNTEDVFEREHPKYMRVFGLSKLVAERAIRSGVMTKTTLLENQKYGKKRNKVFRTHGFRKFVTDGMLRSGISELDINKLLGHKTKNGTLGKNYYRPDEDELLHEYLKAVDALTISTENRVKRENEMLKVKKSDYDQLKEQVANYKREQDELAENNRELMAWLDTKFEGAPAIPEYCCSCKRKFDYDRDDENNTKSKRKYKNGLVTIADWHMVYNKKGTELGQCSECYDNDAPIIHELKFY